MSSSSVSLADTPQLPAERHIMRRDEVERKTGFKRAHIYNLMKEGKFPQAKRIGLRAVGWDSLEIERWIAERLAQQAS
jgi:prophage regulatory protein